MDNIHNLLLIIDNMFHLKSIEINWKQSEFIEKILFFKTNHRDRTNLRIEKKKTRKFRFKMRKVKIKTIFKPSGQTTSVINVKEIFLLHRPRWSSHWWFSGQQCKWSSKWSNPIEHFEIKTKNFILLQHVALPSIQSNQNQINKWNQRNRYEILRIGQHPYLPDDNWQHVFPSGQLVPSKSIEIIKWINSIFVFDLGWPGQGRSLYLNWKPF